MFTETSLKHCEENILQLSPLDVFCIKSVVSWQLIMGHDTFPHCYGSHVWIISSSGTYALEYFCGIFSQIFISYLVLLVSSTGSFQEANKQIVNTHFFALPPPPPATLLLLPFKAHL